MAGQRHLILEPRAFGAPLPTVPPTNTPLSINSIQTFRLPLTKVTMSNADHQNEAIGGSATQPHRPASAPRPACQQLTDQHRSHITLHTRTTLVVCRCGRGSSRPVMWVEYNPYRAHNVPHRATHGSRHTCDLLRLHITRQSKPSRP